MITASTPTNRRSNFTFLRLEAGCRKCMIWDVKYFTPAILRDFCPM